MNTYTPGQLVRLTLSTTSAGVAIAPSSVVCTVENPAGVQTTPSVTNPATGSYYADVSVTTAGMWYYRWTGAAPAQGAAEGFFAVRATEF